jgi:hypothetical protein
MSLLSRICPARLTLAGRFSFVALCFVSFGILMGPICFSQLAKAQSAANTDQTYQALRNLALAPESFSVNNLELKRDAGTFHFRSGTICFTLAVQGKVTGAVFTGDGSFVLDAPATERDMLKLLTKDNEFNESFSQAVLRFTDETYEEIKKAASASSAMCDGGPLKESQRTTRTRIKRNLESRILEDLLSPEQGGLFVAFIHGKRYDDKELFTIDPHKNGDHVEFMTYDENKFGQWASFPLSGERKRGTVGMPIGIDHQQLETTIEGNTNLAGKATTTFVAQLDGERVIPLNLFPSLRVHGVTSDGQALAFIQEDKNEDADFAVILPKALAAGESYTLTTTYSGKEAIINEGNGNYFPISRDDWFPSNPETTGEYASYDMTFRIPKGMKIAATGQLLSESNDGGQDVTVWKSESRQTVAGFNFGKFKLEETKLANPEYSIQSFANQESPDWVKDIQHAASGGDIPTLGLHEETMALGTMSTTSLNKKALAESALAVQVYSDYFGPSEFKHLEVTQQTACNFGQSWPGLIWIPICYYFDTTVRHQLGMDYGDRGYWKVVTPHEVAHQWWGHTVGFNSYRDQWMSEGFADMSASLYLSLIEKNPQKFIAFWNDERNLLLERNAEGFRAIDAGPVTMGYRLSNSRTGFDITRRLIYPKGAYILYMLRTMMHDGRTGDEQFKAMMRDFVKSYTGKSASTEDFKAMVEKHMTPEMNLQGNRKMDWFFDEYVYGTELPTYKSDTTFETGPDGDVVLDLKVTQSGVNDNFRMLVPMYLEMADGNVVMLGRLRITGNKTLDQKLPLKGLKTRPRRFILSYYDDVLASPS